MLPGRNGLKHGKCYAEDRFIILLSAFSIVDNQAAVSHIPSDIWEYKSQISEGESNSRRPSLVCDMRTMQSHQTIEPGRTLSASGVPMHLDSERGQILPITAPHRCVKIRDGSL